MLRLNWPIRLAILFSVSVTWASSAAAQNNPGSRAGGRSQQRAVIHTTDPLDAVLDRVNEKSAILIDVREQNEWDDGHLRHAVFLPLSKLRGAATDPEIREKLAKLSKDKVVYCHCKAGGRVLSAAPILKSYGFDARPLKAGYDDLLKAGFEKSTKQTDAIDSEDP